MTAQDRRGWRLALRNAIGSADICRSDAARGNAGTMQRKAGFTPTGHPRRQQCRTPPGGRLRARPRRQPVRFRLSWCLFGMVLLATSSG